MRKKRKNEKKSEKIPVYREKVSHGNYLVRIGFDIFYSLFSRDGGNLLFESFNGREEFEDHHEDEEESREDDGVHVVLDADECSEGVADAGKCDDDSHAAPDDEAYEELEYCLTALILEIIGDALIEHEGGDDEDDDLIECEGHKTINS